MTLKRLRVNPYILWIVPEGNLTQDQA